LKRVVSIEKFRGSLRRFRSWSQDALARSSMDNPANSSVDSTLNTQSRASIEGGGLQGRDTISGAGGGGGGQHQQRSLKSSNKKPQATSKSTVDIISEPYLDDDELKPLIYGYLRKLGRNGHWQKRFFESNGERLTYYKSTKRTKVLATLDLCKVGEIAIDKTDPEECTFTIQVSHRPYYLRAEDKARCNDWVIILNRAREARMNVGNIQLVKPNLEGGGVGSNGLTHRSQAGSDDYAPCIVISALRPRTQAVMNFEVDENLGGQGVPDLLGLEEEEQIEVMKRDDHHPNIDQLPVSPLQEHYQQQQHPGESIAKWQKRHSKMHTLSLRFLKWARSITHQADACRREGGVVVVPAHVVMAAQQTILLAAAQGGGGAALPGAITGATGGTAAASAGAGGGQPQQQQGTEHKRNRSGGMPNLMEETQETPSTPGADNPDSSVNNRSRASTESPAFGSTYV